jgi:hypothetical protein
MLVFQPLQPGGRDVVFERRPRFLAHRSSERPLVRICQSVMGFRVLVGVTQPRKVRSSVPIIPRTVNVT